MEVIQGLLCNLSAIDQLTQSMNINNEQTRHNHQLIEGIKNQVSNIDNSFKAFVSNIDRGLSEHKL